MININPIPSIEFIGDSMLFYLIGIKGAALSALANVLKEQGHIVKGVDTDTYFYTEKNIRELKVESFNHMNLKPSYFYIIGNAYIHHGVTRYIKHSGYRFMLYPDFIAYYFKNYNFISVCGSHGKTTTTKMIGSLMKNASYIIGDGSGCGKSTTNFILESCEYRNTFLHYFPNIALILNIDYDHPDFFKTPMDYVEAFAAFSRQANIVVANGDDENVRRIKRENFITYGLKKDNDIPFEYTLEAGYMNIKILERIFCIPVLGKHYAYDFVGAYLVAKLNGLTDEEIIQNLKKFSLPKRRMETKEVSGCIIIHDYAHHPTEIKSVYESIRLMYPTKKIICIFQPHTISRSITLREDFKEVLSLFDKTYVINIFTSVRESINREKEKEIFRYWGYPVLSNEEIKQLKKDAGIVYAFLGAGDIDTVFTTFANSEKNVEIPL